MDAYGFLFTHFKIKHGINFIWMKHNPITYRSIEYFLYPRVDILSFLLPNQQINFIDIRTRCQQFVDKGCNKKEGEFNFSKNHLCN